MKLTPASLVEEAQTMGDLVMSKGWEALMIRVNHFLVSKSDELQNLTYQYCFAKGKRDREDLAEAVLNLRADIRAVSLMFSIPSNIIGALKDQMINPVAQNDPLEEAKKQADSNNGSIIVTR